VIWEVLFVGKTRAAGGATSTVGRLLGCSGD